MLVYRTMAEKVFWKFDSIIMQNLSDVVVFCVCNEIYLSAIWNLRSLFLEEAPVRVTYLIHTSNKRKKQVL